MSNVRPLFKVSWLLYSNVCHLFCRKRRRWQRRQQGKTIEPRLIFLHVCCHNSAVVCITSMVDGWTASHLCAGVTGLSMEVWTCCSLAFGFESTRSLLLTVHSFCFSGRWRPRDSSRGTFRDGVEPFAGFPGQHLRSNWLCLAVSLGMEYLSARFHGRGVKCLLPQSLSVKGKWCLRLIFIEL